MTRPRKYNWKLREQREHDTVSLDGFPLVIRIKPTSHKQYCLVCRNMVEKGEKQITLPHGMWAKHRGMSPSAVFGRLHPTGEVRYYTRYVYLHTACFGCVLNKMMLKAGLPQLQVKLTCESCKNRFNCWTGNMDEEWQGMLPTYIPSRPCGDIEDL